MTVFDMILVVIGGMFAIAAVILAIYLVRLFTAIDNLLED